MKLKRLNIVLSVVTFAIGFMLLCWGVAWFMREGAEKGWPLLFAGVAFTYTGYRQTVADWWRLWPVQEDS